MVPVLFVGVPISVPLINIFIWDPLYTPTKWYQVLFCQAKVALWLVPPVEVCRNNLAVVPLTTRSSYNSLLKTLPPVLMLSPLSQRESVMALPVIFKEVLFGIRTSSFVPSKSIAPPNLPFTHTGPFCSVPVLLFPEESVAAVPEPSSNFQWATGFEEGGGGVGVAVGEGSGVGDVPPASAAVLMRTTLFVPEKSV